MSSEGTGKNFSNKTFYSVSFTFSITFQLNLAV